MDGVNGLVTRLARLDTPALSDALDRFGLAGVADGLAPMWRCGRVAGPVRTVTLGPAQPEAPLPARHLGAGAVAEAEPGDVVVVDNAAGGQTVAGWGGLLGRAATRQGVAGVVVSGACRDVDELAESGLPVFARAATPRSARGRVVEVAHGEPLDLAGGVRVAQDDLVLADRSGVVFVPAAQAAQVVSVAEDLAAREAGLAARLWYGAPVTDVLGSGYEAMSRAGAPDATQAEGAA